MFSYKAVLRDVDTGVIYTLEHPPAGQWRFYCDSTQLALVAEPRMYSDGGTIVAHAESGEHLEVPQQLFEEREPKRPTLNGHELELVEWWLGGQRYLNGEQF